MKRRKIKKAKKSILRKVYELGKELDKFNWVYSIHVVVGDINNHKDQLIGYTRVSDSSVKGAAVLVAEILANEKHCEPAKRLYDFLRIASYDDEFLAKVDLIVRR